MAFLKTAVLVGGLALVAGCTLPGNEYRLGDGAARYCESTDPEVRAAGRVLAARAGTTLPDLCAAHAFMEDVEAHDGE